MSLKSFVKSALRLTLAPPGLDRLSGTDSAGSLGRVPVPGTATLTLPQGRCTARYEIATYSPDSSIDAPTDLEVTITGADGTPVGRSRKGGFHASGNRPPRTSVRWGVFDIPATGVYTVTTSQPDPDPDDPAILLGG